MRQRTLLAVHAHPDDETITTGGTLARYGAAGVRTIVVCCTAGDLGVPAAPTAQRRNASLATRRSNELATAAKVLGLSRVVQLGYADSGMAGWPSNHAPESFFAADLDRAAAKLIDVLDEERPDVVLTYDHTGGYGHPDHVKAHQVTWRAFERSGAAQPKRIYVVRFPISWAREFVRALRAAGIDAPASAAAGADAGPDAAEIGVPDNLVTTVLDVRRYVATKRAALACHTSQMGPDSFLMRMPPELAERLWAAEYFSREAGPPAAPLGELETDLFAGLD